MATKNFFSKFSGENPNNAIAKPTVDPSNDYINKYKIKDSGNSSDTGTNYREELKKATVVPFKKEPKSKEDEIPIINRYRLDDNTTTTNNKPVTANNNNNAQSNNNNTNKKSPGEMTMLRNEIKHATSAAAGAKKEEVEDPLAKYRVTNNQKLDEKFINEMENDNVYKSKEPVLRQEANSAKQNFIDDLVPLNKNSPRVDGRQRRKSDAEFLLRPTVPHEPTDTTSGRPRGNSIEKKEKKEHSERRRRKSSADRNKNKVDKKEKEEKRERRRRRKAEKLGGGEKVSKEERKKKKKERKEKKEKKEAEGQNQTPN